MACTLCLGMADCITKKDISKLVKLDAFVVRH
jgi:hypothetical protein